jgi:hypothetical protein
MTLSGEERYNIDSTSGANVLIEGAAVQNRLHKEKIEDLPRF